MNTPRTWQILTGALILTAGCSGLLGFDDLGFEGAAPDGGTGGAAGMDGGGAGGAGAAGAAGQAGGHAGEGGTGPQAGAAGFGGGGGVAGAAGTGGDAGVTGGGAGTDAGVTDGGGDAGATGGTGGTTNPTDPPPLDLGDVTWLHTNVSGWPVTVTMTSVTFEGSQICLHHDIASKGWPTEVVNGTEVVGNAWVFIYEDDRWYGATWEWLRAPGQTCKNQSSVAGDHIKEAPFDAASGWHPTSGQTLYFMVSGFARLGLTNVQERSDPVKVLWP